MDLLRVQRIAQAQAWQRTGRAGRQAAGCCYRTYTLQVNSVFNTDSIFLIISRVVVLRNLRSSYLTLFRKSNVS